MLTAVLLSLIYCCVSLQKMLHCRTCRLPSVLLYVYMLVSSGAYVPDVKCSVDFGWWSVTFCWGYGEPALPRLWHILSRHFTLYVMRRVWVVTLHCMLCADSESSLYIVCYVQILSHHFTLCVMCRFWVITLHCVLCADSESSLYIVCYAQSPSGHFTLYVMRRFSVVTLHCMLCADSEWSLYTGCYAQILSHHCTLYVMCRTHRAPWSMLWPSQRAQNPKINEDWNFPPTILPGTGPAAFFFDYIFSVGPERILICWSTCLLELNTLGSNQYMQL